MFLILAAVLGLKAIVPVALFETHPADMSASWSQRLAVAQSKTPAPEQESLAALTLNDLQDAPVTFGKTHLGKTHEKVWKSDPQWVKWFLSHYQFSPKM